MVKSFNLKALSLHFGASPYTFSLGFTISRFGLEVNLGFIWLSLEY